jgi:hypothetical protein
VGTGPKERALTIEAWAEGDGPAGLERVEVLRNGEPYRTFPLQDHPKYVRTVLKFRENQTAWYCVRAFGLGVKRPVAISSAFFFDDGSYRPPQPAWAQVHATIVDDLTGKPLSGIITEVTYSGTLTRNSKQEHGFTQGEARLHVPGTVRLSAVARGYEPRILSPVLDNAELVSFITRLGDDDLLDWNTFELIRKQLSQVNLTFKLHKASSK